MSEEDIRARVISQGISLPAAEGLEASVPRDPRAWLAAASSASMEKSFAVRPCYPRDIKTRSHQAIMESNMSDKAGFLRARPK